jgi:hypothetical protein
MHHVQAAAPQGPAIGRREDAPRRGWTAPGCHGLDGTARGREGVHRAGISGEERLGHPGDHPIRLVERLARLEQLPHLGEERHLPSTLLQFVGVVPELLIGLLQLVLEVRPGRDVGDGGEHEWAAPRSHRRQADFGRELRAVAAASGELQPTGHRTGGRANAIPGPVRGVAVGEARGNEEFDRLSAELVR